MILFIIFFTIAFLIFVELYVGSVMFRYNSENKLSFNLWSGLNFLVHPLHNSFLWNRHGLLMNYPFMITLGIATNLILRYLFFDKHHGIYSRFDKDSTHANLGKDIQ